MKELVSSILDKINKSRNIGITVHINPDGDAIGSMLALNLFLKMLDKPVAMYAENVDVIGFSGLSGINDIKKIPEHSPEHDLLITLDCGNENRIISYDILKAGMVINIDHHADNSRFGDINWVGDHSSVGEMLYFLVVESQKQLTKDIADCLFVSMYTDTGGFKYLNTSSQTFKVAAALMDTGISPADLISMLHDNKEVKDIKDLGDTLATVDSDESQQIVWAVQKKLDYEMVFEPVNFLRSVKTCKVAVLFKERDDGVYKISLRSHGDVDVSAIAHNFGGGGHKAAAGADVSGTEAEVVKKVVDYTKNVL